MTQQTASTSTLAPHSTTHIPPQKNYEAAFGALQCKYGMGGLPTPPLPSKDAKKQKWYKWGASGTSSTTSLLRPPMRSATTPPLLPSKHDVPARETLSEPELQLGKLMEHYGHGFVPRLGAHSDRK